MSRRNKSNTNNTKKKQRTHKIIAFKQRTSRRNIQNEQKPQTLCNVLCCKIKLIHSSECCTNNVQSTVFIQRTQPVTVSDLIMFYWQVNIFMLDKYTVSVWNNYVPFRQARVIRELFFSRFRQLLSNLKLQFPLTMKRFYDKKSPK